MSNPEVSEQPLFVEQALVDITRRNSEVIRAEPIKYPAHLGTLIVGAVHVESAYDGSRVIEGVMADLEASYVVQVHEPEEARSVRQRSMAWLDWLVQTKRLEMGSSAYIKLATLAAQHGDTDTVYEIVQHSERLWQDLYTDRDSSQLRRPGMFNLGRLAVKIPELAHLMRVPSGQNAAAVREMVMPKLHTMVSEFVRSDLTDRGDSIERASAHLLAVGTSEAIKLADKLVAAMPMTPAKRDVLVRLAEQHDRFTVAATEARAWYDQKTALARQTLGSFMRLNGMGRDTLDIERFADQAETEAKRKQLSLAATIVGQIPAGSTTSPIETSVAYAINTSSSGGSGYGNALRCARLFIGDPHFEFADPQFGFSSNLEDGGLLYAYGRIAIADPNLPKGQVMIDLSSDLFRGSIAFTDIGLFCNIIQEEKDRRQGKVV